jgi:hypothetical protein
VVNAKDNYITSEGDILELKEDDDTGTPYFNNLTNGRKDFACFWHRLEYAPKLFSPEGLSVGGIIVNKLGGKAKVLEVGKSSFLRSMWDNYTQASGWRTFEEVISNGWKIEEEKEEEVKLTPAEKAIKLLESKGYKIIKE